MDDPRITPEEAMARIQRSKLERRRQLARLPFEEKFRLVVQMKRLSAQAGAAVFVRPDDPDAR